MENGMSATTFILCVCLKIVKSLISLLYSYTDWCLQLMWCCLSDWLAGGWTVPRAVSRPALLGCWLSVSTTDRRDRSGTATMPHSAQLKTTSAYIQYHRIVVVLSPWHYNSISYIIIILMIILQIKLNTPFIRREMWNILCPIPWVSPPESPGCSPAPESPVYLRAW